MAFARATRSALASAAGLEILVPGWLIAPKTAQAP